MSVCGTDNKEGEDRRVLIDYYVLMTAVVDVGWLIKMWPCFNNLRIAYSLAMPTDSVKSRMLGFSAIDLINGREMPQFSFVRLR